MHAGPHTSEPYCGRNRTRAYDFFRVRVLRCLKQCKSFACIKISSETQTIVLPGQSQNPGWRFPGEVKNQVAGLGFEPRIWRLRARIRYEHSTFSKILENGKTLKNSVTRTNIPGVLSPNPGSHLLKADNQCRKRPFGRFLIR